MVSNANTNVAAPAPPHLTSPAVLATITAQVLADRSTDLIRKLRESHPQQRGLDPKDEKLLNITLHNYKEACSIQMRGVVMADNARCKTCIRGGIFKTCISIATHRFGSCGCCIHTNHPRKCTLTPLSVREAPNRGKRKAERDFKSQNKAAKKARKEAKEEIIEDENGEDWSTGVGYAS